MREPSQARQGVSSAAWAAITTTNDRLAETEGARLPNRASREVTSLEGSTWESLMTRLALLALATPFTKNHPCPSPQARDNKVGSCEVVHKSHASGRHACVEPALREAGLVVQRSPGRLDADALQMG